MVWSVQGPVDKLDQDSAQQCSDDAYVSIVAEEGRIVVGADHSRRQVRTSHAIHGRFIVSQQVCNRPRLSCPFFSIGLVTVDVE